MLSILLTGVDFIVDESGVVVAIEIAASPIDLYQRRAAFSLCRLIGNHQPISLEIHIVERQVAAPVQIPVHRGQSFRRIADSVPVIADSFR
jgi:hypothetical protein